MSVHHSIKSDVALQRACGILNISVVRGSDDQSRLKNLRSKAPTGRFFRAPIQRHRGGRDHQHSRRRHGRVTNFATVTAVAHDHTQDSASQLKPPSASTERRDKTAGSMQTRH